MSEVATQRMPEQTDVAWHQQFWPWFIIGILSVTVCAGIVTITLAIKYDDALVVDDYYKQGLAINRVLTRQQQAHEQGISARLSLSGPQQLLLRLSGQTSLTEPLRLRLVHATQASRDREYQLVAGTAGLYRLALGDLPAGRWRLIIEPLSAQWQLEQSIQFPFPSPLTIQPQL